jgi:hypothetical protein
VILCEPTRTAGIFPPLKRDFRVRFSASIPLVVPSKKAPFRNDRRTDQRETKAARFLHIETPSRCLETLPMGRDKNATLTLRSRVQGICRPREYVDVNQEKKNAVAVCAKSSSRQ